MTKTALMASINLGRRIVSAALLFAVTYTFVCLTTLLVRCLNNPPLLARLCTPAGMLELGAALIICPVIGAGVGGLGGIIGENPTDKWIHADGFGVVGLLIGASVGGFIGFYRPEIAVILERPFMWQPDPNLRDLVGACAGILIGGIVGGLGMAWIGEMTRLIRNSTDLVAEPKRKA